MHEEGASVIIGRKSVNEFCTVFTVEENLVINLFLVSIQFRLGVAIILTVLGDTEMFNVYGLL